MKVALDVETLAFVIHQRVEERAKQLMSGSGDVETVRRLNRLLDLVRSLPFPVSLWEAQNAAYTALSKATPDLHPEWEQDMSMAQSWSREVASLKENGPAESLMTRGLAPHSNRDYGSRSTAREA